MRNGSEPGSATGRATGERLRPTLVLLPTDGTQAVAEVVERHVGDLLDRICSCADLALEAQHQLELRENEARKDRDLAEIHRLDATAEMYRQSYLTLCGLRGALLRNSRAIEHAADQFAAINNSLDAEIHNVQRSQPSVERLTSIVADIDKVLAVIFPLVTG